ncbi:lysophospholipase L1-like esterase [Alteromonadaceae bacterium 2753L.S.0a.02]|nr:lysophospholipase L1-like esterase [Alteromonadaceae bacterium 2753L.S.0a.02]
MNKTLVNGLLLAFSVIFALMICEVLVRTFKLAPEIVYIEKWRVRLSDNPKIGYEPIPNLDSSGQSAQYYSYIGRSNNMGYRDYNHPLAKTPGSKRIVILGDSVTAGLWIKGDKNIFSVVMEQELNTWGVKSDVMNFGVSGYNTSQEVETLKSKALAFKPDLVILAYCLNDRFQDDGNIYGLLLAEQSKNLSGGKINTAAVTKLEHHSALLRFLHYAVLGVKQGATRKGLQSEVNKFYVDSVEDSFAELAELANQNDFDVLVAVFPNFGERDQGLVGDYKFQSEHDSVNALAQRYNFHYFDLLQPFRECKKQLPSRYTISFDQYHPNIVGNQCAGKALAQQARNILGR